MSSLTSALPEVNAHVHARERALCTLRGGPSSQAQLRMNAQARGSGAPLRSLASGPSSGKHLGPYFEF